MTIAKKKITILAPFTFIYSYRNLLWQTILQDTRAKFSGSVFGVLWVFIQPIIFLSVYSIIYIFVFNVRFHLFNTTQYVVIIFCGLIPFLGVAESLATGVTSVTANASLIKNTLFPIALIPVKSVLTSQLSQAVGSILLVITVAIVGNLSLYILFFPFIWLLQILFLLGLVWILSSINVYLKDLQHMIGSMILMLMMISPIAYTADMVPENLNLILWLNPLSHLIISYQEVLMFEKFPLWHFIIFFCLSLSCFYLGYNFFKYLNYLFIDNI
jgi:lipopolysaccharide transport system permease protein